MRIMLRINVNCFKVFASMKKVVIGLAVIKKNTIGLWFHFLVRHLAMSIWRL